MVTETPLGVHLVQLLERRPFTDGPFDHVRLATERVIEERNVHLVRQRGDRRKFVLGERPENGLAPDHEEFVVPDQRSGGTDEVLELFSVHWLLAKAR